MRVIAFKARFSGMYQWGSGWTDITRDRWNGFFEGMAKSVQPVFWRYFKTGGASDPQYLVSTSGSVYLHPMIVQYVGSSETVCTKGLTGEEAFPEIDELKEILTAAANACGGRVEFSEVVRCEIDTPRFVHEEGRKEEMK